MSIRLVLTLVLASLIISCRNRPSNETAVTLPIDHVQLETGAGVFSLRGGPASHKEVINVYYYQPESFTKDSEILLVIPGAGRNGDDYRDSWIAAAEKHSVLVLSPSYSAATYPFDSYHLCGLIENSNLAAALSKEEGTRIEWLDEQLFSFTLNTQREEWLFADFDRIFSLVKKETASTQTHYDIFGHSVGGQIMHRLVLFYPDTKADKIVAANAGFYTLPDRATPLPFGVKGTLVDTTSLQRSFKKQLILLVGELDNKKNLLSSVSADRQGENRLERGAYFYEFSQKTAAESGKTFNWTIDTIPQTGHSYAKMGAAAARWLYGDR